MTTVTDAFERARTVAGSHMAASEAANLFWGETAITEMLLAHTAPAVTVVPFTQRAEALSGADWVWWWVDGSAAYGMLIQAKRVIIRDQRWNFKFDYRSRGSARSQREVLIDTAATLGVLPVHALYLGTGDYRSWAPCAGSHQANRCRECTRRTISLMPALLATDLFVDDAASTYEWSVALEDLWSPSSGGALLIPAVERAMSPQLKRFLKNDSPDGVRAVARSMIDRVLKAGAGQFSAATTDTVPPPAGAHDRLGSIFQRLPADTMHGGVRYFEHVLTPLKHSPPSYVLDIMTGDVDKDALQAQMPEAVGGITVVQTPLVREER